MLRQGLFGVLAFREEPGILDRVGQLIGHGLKRGDIFVGEGSRLSRLDRHRPDRAAAADQRQPSLERVSGSAGFFNKAAASLTCSSMRDCRWAIHQPTIVSPPTSMRRP